MSFYPLFLPSLWYYHSSKLSASSSLYRPVANQNFVAKTKLYLN